MFFQQGCVGPGKLDWTWQEQRQEKQDCSYRPQINSYFTAPLKALFEKAGK